VPKKVLKMFDYLFIDTYKTNEIKLALMNLMVNDNEMCMRWNTNLVNTGDISPEIAYRGLICEFFVPDIIILLSLLLSALSSIQSQ